MEDFANLWSQIHLPNGKEKTSISKIEAEFLWNLVKENKIQHTLEIGLGYGTSSCAIADNAIAHTTIEPNEERYQTLGRIHLEKTQLLAKTTILNVPSYIALPELLQQGKQFGLIFIDGSHRFEDVFLDLSYSLKLVSVGGYIALHDCFRPANKKILKYIQANILELEAIPSPSTDLSIFKKTDKRPLSYTEFTDF